jgi:hypothetical protein
MKPLTLAELIDIEAQLLDDREQSPGEIARRDERIAEKLGPGAAKISRHELLRQWLAAVADPREVSVGRRVSAYYRLAGWILPIVTFIAGAGTAAGLLVYDGRDPVNIMGYLAVLVFLQAALVLLTLVGMLPSTWLGGLLRLSGLTGGAGFQSILRELGYRRAGIASMGATLSFRGRAALGHIAAWQTIYAAVERWLLTALTQRAAVAFNVGALVATIYLVTVRALAFAWSTTLEVDTEQMTRILHAIATPWRWLEVAVPSHELVEASRYFPGRSYDPDLLGDWWLFLVAALVTYGLLPRIVLSFYAAYRARAARRALALDHGECAAVCERLARPASLWGRPTEVGTAVTPVSGAVSSSECTLPASGTTVRVLRWADAAVSQEDVARVLGEKLGWRLSSLDDVRGDDDPEELRRLARLAENDQPILVVAESFEPPSKNVQRLLKTIRQRAGAQVPLVVGLYGDPSNGASPRPDDVRIWRQRIAALGDPWIRVEALS